MFVYNRFFILFFYYIRLFYKFKIFKNMGNSICFQGFYGRCNIEFVCSYQYCYWYYLIYYSFFGYMFRNLQIENIINGIFFVYCFENSM